MKEQITSPCWLYWRNKLQNIGSVRPLDVKNHIQNDIKTFCTNIDDYQVSSSGVFMNARDFLKLF